MNKVNFFEMEIEKYRRRVERIKNNPEAARAASNLLLYEAWLQRRKIELEAWMEDRPFVYCMTFHELLESMNILSVPCGIFADLASTLVPDCLREYNSRGYPNAVCDRLQIWLGMTFGGLVPSPIACVGGSPACEIEQQMVIIPAHYYKVPYFNVDRCMEPGYEPVEYILRQLRELIQFLERVVPGAKWDEEKLGAILDKRRLAQQYIHEALYESAKNVPCSITGKDTLRIPFLGLAYRSKGLEYFEVFRNEMVHKAKSGISALSQEKLRFMWTMEVPHHTEALDFLEKHGVAVPLYLFDALDQFCGVGDFMTWGKDERYKGLSPLEEYARLQLGWTWGGPIEQWVTSVINHCREFSIDGVIYCIRSGCPQGLGGWKIVQERLKTELGIPMLVVEGHISDPQRWDDKSFIEQIGLFVNMCLEMKNTKPTD